MGLVYKIAGCEDPGLGRAERKDLNKVVYMNALRALSDDDRERILIIAEQMIDQWPEKYFGYSQAYEILSQVGICLAAMSDKEFEKVMKVINDQDGSDL